MPPASKPFVFGRIPSMRDGRLLEFAGHVNSDAQMSLDVTADRGALRDSSEPFFYLYFGGATLAMTNNDMHECIEEMQYTRQRKEADRPSETLDARELKNKVGDLIEAVKDARVGRRRF